MSKLTKDDRQYVEHMKSWIQERHERIKVNDATKKGALKIAKHQDIQKGIEQEWTRDTIKEYNGWRKKNSMKPIKIPKWAEKRK